MPSGTRPTAARRRASLRRLAAASLVAAAACSGPTLRIVSEGPAYLDGRRVRPGFEVPFRYYGEAAVLVLPAEPAAPDWGHQPARTQVPIPPPVPSWLFPLDLPLELLTRLWSDPDDRTVALAPAVTPDPVVEGFPPDGVERVRVRAFAARTAR